MISIQVFNVVEIEGERAALGQQQSTYAHEQAKDGQTDLDHAHRENVHFEYVNGKHFAQMFNGQEEAERRAAYFAWE